MPASSSTHSKPLAQRQFLYFLPLPQGQGALRESLLRAMTFSSQARQRFVDTQCVYPYTNAYTITRTGFAMNPIKIGKRVVVIAGTTPTGENADCRKPIEQWSTARRIVVIRDGKSVGRRRGR